MIIAIIPRFHLLILVIQFNHSFLLTKVLLISLYISLYRFSVIHFGLDKDIDKISHFKTSYEVHMLLC